MSTSAAAKARRIFEEVRTLLAVGVPAREIAILVRVRDQIPILREEARRWEIPVYTPPKRDDLDTDEEPDVPLPPEAAVPLLTIHQAKGCEWTLVFVAGCQEGIVPSPLAMTDAQRREEIRLLYVAVTRAKQLLWLSRYGAPSPPLASIESAFTAPARRLVSPSWLDILRHHLRAWWLRHGAPHSPAQQRHPRANA